MQLSASSYKVTTRSEPVQWGGLCMLILGGGAGGVPATEHPGIWWKYLVWVLWKCSGLQKSVLTNDNDDKRSVDNYP